MKRETHACATCASVFGNASDPMSEKPLLPGRHLNCCGRSICSRCLNQNKRYETYCPYCQITTQPSLLPQGLRDPPAYSTLDNRLPPPSSSVNEDELPAYSEHQAVQPVPEKAQPAEDVLHFVRPEDNMLSLALAYGVPINVLRKTNNIYSDHLLKARKTVLIPGGYYKGGVSLSAQPTEGEEEEARKNKLRRFQVATKVADIPFALRYDVAELYLQNSDWHLEAAIEAFKEDELWEKQNPLQASSRGKKGKNAQTVGMRRFVGSSR
ncbi:hypothetical protein AC579_2374 [Pseudocercospora musae]|uniref:LysM domain-containing protein n=1 Tax=Pseudocercospora musae TaxID=113226 RepID=A0A139IGU6_9PEZI|nr:hypothetical protein AC579_2374 [Pseudocercospora musae]